MTPKPGVVDTLNALLKLEITLHEGEHGWEKVWECAKYKKLRKWYDKLIEMSRCHRRYLQKRIIRFGDSLKIEMVPITIDPSLSPASVMTRSLEFVTTVLEAYRAAYKAIEDAGDPTTADDICERTKDMEQLVFDLEAFSRQIDDIGLQQWLAEHL